MPSKNIVELKLKHESSMYHNAFSNIGSSRNDRNWLLLSKA